MRDCDLSKIHYLTGPFNIETAEPGDVLLVEIQDVQPLQEHPWGFTGVFAKENGGGFLDEIYPKPYVRLLSYESYVNKVLERKLSGISRVFSAPHDTSPVSALRASFTLVFWAVHHLQKY